MPVFGGARTGRSGYVHIGAATLWLDQPLKLSPIKPRLPGHWRTTPGLKLIYVHLNRLIKHIQRRAHRGQRLGHRRRGRGAMTHGRRSVRVDPGADPPGVGVNDAAVALQRDGSCVLGELHLALPMEALREVVRCGPLIALPRRAAGVLGGIDLRGVVVPVLDLRQRLGHEVRAGERPCVIVMVHDGDILGLLAERVSGVFAAEAARLASVSAADDQPLLFSGCLQLDDGSRISVLVPGVLAQLP